MCRKFLQDEQQYLQALQNKIFPEKIKKYTKTFEKKAKEQDFKPLNALFASMEKLGSDDDPDHLALFKLQKHLTKPIDLVSVRVSTYSVGKWNVCE